MTTQSSNAAVADATGPEGLTARLVARSDLSTACIRAMFELYASNYADTSEAVFQRDLAQKTHVLLLSGARNDVCGFTTIELYRTVAAGQPLRVLFSGDTIIDPEHWGSQVLAREWIRFAGQVARDATLPLYWLLIVKGHRTYRFLPAFARRYIPHHGLPEQPAEREILSALAREKFGHHFNEATGVVHFDTPQGRLCEALAEVPGQHRKLPAVEHFLRLNPGYRDGDELVCLCRLVRENLRPFAARVFEANDEHLY